MAEPTPRAENPNDVGVFITSVPVGYLEPAKDTIRRIDDYARTLVTQADASLLRNLLTIKLLAPRESEDLVICNVPMAAEFINRLKTVLAMRYYTTGVER